jgi:hypothetical protein
LGARAGGQGGAQQAEPEGEGQGQGLAPDEAIGEEPQGGLLGHHHAQAGGEALRHGVGGVAGVEGGHRDGRGDGPQGQRVAQPAPGAHAHAGGHVEEDEDPHRREHDGDHALLGAEEDEVDPLEQRHHQRAPERYLVRPAWIWL